MSARLAKSWLGSVYRRAKRTSTGFRPFTTLVKVSASIVTTPGVNSSTASLPTQIIQAITIITLAIGVCMNIYAPRCLLEAS